MLHRISLRQPLLNSTSSCFGPATQVANYSQSRDITVPFKPFLTISAKVYFESTPSMDVAFTASKQPIIHIIQQGTDIFDYTKRAYLHADWSQCSSGYFLSQKHCT